MRTVREVKEVITKPSEVKFEEERPSQKYALPTCNYTSHFSAYQYKPDYKPVVQV